MPALYSRDQILSLAPDASSGKAAQGLLNTRLWSNLGQQDSAVWGECQGSGKSPYQVQADLTEPAFNCTCPSRKFPCKHGLALLLLRESQPGTFRSAATRPAWVDEWLASRKARAEKKQTTQDTAVPRAAASAKTIEERDAKVAAGLAELRLWLQDMVRHGLAELPSRPASFWEGRAARLVDAQAPGAARMVRELAQAVIAGPGWEERLLAQIGTLYLMIEGFSRITTLTPEEQADLRTAIGFTQSQEAVLAGTGIADHWLVLGRCMEQQDRLRVQRTWLLGQQTGQMALLLAFAHGREPFDTSWLPGTAAPARLAFYSSATPLRALVQERSAAMEVTSWPQQSLAEAYRRWQELRNCNPWLEMAPLWLSKAVPERRGHSWIVRDSHSGLEMRIGAQSDAGWTLAALSGGHPVWLTAEMRGDSLYPLLAVAEGRLIPLAGMP